MHSLRGKELSKVSKFRLLVPSHGDKEGFLKNLSGNHLDRRLRNRLDVTRIARECSEWLISIEKEKYLLHKLW
jgi:hypothetical protein